jgi:hypothetical protein
MHTYHGHQSSRQRTESVRGSGLRQRVKAREMDPKTSQRPVRVRVELRGLSRRRASIYSPRLNSLFFNFVIFSSILSTELG